MGITVHSCHSKPPVLSFKPQGEVGLPSLLEMGGALHPARANGL